MDTMQAAFLYRDQPESETENLTDYLQEQDWVGDLGRMGSKKIQWRYLIAVGDPCLILEQTTIPAKQLSKKIPLLFFVTTDEYSCDIDEEESNFSGWGFRIYHEGVEKVRVNLSYSWPSYGQELETKLQEVLGPLDVSLFELFSLEKERLEALQSLLGADALFKRLEDADVLEDIEREFTRILDIENDFLVQE